MIPIDNGVYDVLVRGAESKVSIERVQKTTKVGLFEFSGGLADLKYDIHGRLSFSKVSVEVPGRFGMARRHDKFFDSDRLTIIEKAVEHLNRLTDVLRHVTRDFSIPRVRYPDTLGFRISHLSNGNETPASVGFSTGTGGIIMTTGVQMQYLSVPQKNEVILKLREETSLDASISFLLDAKSALLDEDYSLATVLAVIALEVAFSEAATRRGKKKGLKPEQVEELVKALGIKTSLENLLKLLLEATDPVPDSRIVETCSGAITMRNHVVHRGVRVVPKGETEERVVAVEKMLDFLSSLKNT